MDRLSPAARRVRAWMDAVIAAVSVYTPAVTWTVVIADTALGAGMLFQPERFSRTPSYGNLIAIAPAQVWGVAYVAVAAGLVAWRVSLRPAVGVIAHMAVAGLTFGWFCAFVIRYLTDSSTTIVNVVTWGVLLSLVARSVIGLDEDDQ